MNRYLLTVLLVVGFFSSFVAAQDAAPATDLSSLSREEKVIKARELLAEIQEGKIEKYEEELYPLLNSGIDYEELGMERRLIYYLNIGAAKSFLQECRNGKTENAFLLSYGISDGIVTLKEIGTTQKEIDEYVLRQHIALAKAEIKRFRRTGQLTHNSPKTIHKALQEKQVTFRTLGTSACEVERIKKLAPPPAKKEVLIDALP